MSDRLRIQMEFSDDAGGACTVRLTLPNGCTFALAERVDRHNGANCREVAERMLARAIECARIERGDSWASGQNVPSNPVGEHRRDMCSES